MNRIHLSVLACLALFATMMGFGHETQTVGEGDDQYNVSVGYATEPPYTEDRNGLALTIRTASGEPVENLENSLAAELTAPNGETLPLTLRAVHGQAGSYTDDFVLTEPGVYQLSVTGFIGGTEVNLTFDLHEVAPLDDLRFP